MYINYNAHPKGIITSDCVVRAISKAFNKDYFETRLELNRTKKQLGFKNYKEKGFMTAYMKNFKKISFPAVTGYPRTKGYDFVSMYPKGVYILNMAGHVTVCINGSIYDIWDCSYRTVYNAWKIS